jgi:DNA-directed RNA polymerase specialized sigma24 family protein
VARGGVEQVDALDAITEQDLRYLGAVAARLCVGDTISADDLVNEALARTLTGDRAWRDDLPLRTQLISTMKSVLSAWRKARARKPEVQWNDAVDTLVLDGDGDMAVCEPFEVRLQEELQEIDKLLANDQSARDLMYAAMEGFEREELEEVTGLTANGIIAARERIKRLLAKREN